jgi:hypothetical protein
MRLITKSIDIQQLKIYLYKKGKNYFFNMKPIVLFVAYIRPA